MHSNFWPPGMRSSKISVMTILDESFSLLRREYALVLAVGALLIVPLTLLSSFLTDRVAPDVKAHTQRLADLSNQIDNHDSVANSAWTHALVAVIKDYVKIFAVSGGTALLQACLAGCALAVAVCLICLGRQTTVVASYRFAARRFAKAISATLAAAAFVLLCAGVPALLGVVTGSADVISVLMLGSLILVVILGVRLSLLIQIIAIEGRGLSALARSYSLTRGYFWKVLGLMLLTSFVVLLMINLTDAIVMRTTNNSLVDLLANLIITTAVSPLVLCAQTLLYLRLRIAKEDLSPQTLAGDLDAV